MNQDAFLRMLADQLTAELTPNAEIKKFADNSDVIGAFAETSVRRFVAKMVSPANVSTGAIISENLCDSPKDVPHIDIITLTPMPVPPIFAIGDFGLVPSISVLGFLEVKRSNYSGAGAAITKALEREVQLVPSIGDGEYDGLPRSLGVVCVRESARGDNPLKALVDANRAVVLLDIDDKGMIMPNPIAVYKLIDFLMKIRRKMSMIDGKTKITFTPK